MKFDRAVWFTILAPLIAVPVLLFAGARAGAWTPFRIAGLGLTLGALILITIARVNLGNSFSIEPEAKKLVTNGIYARVRHPIYVGSVLFLTGIALYFGIPVLLVAVAVVVLIQIARARAENKILERKFGEEYRAYRRTTWF